MGIPNGSYDIELIRRTKKLLETYNGEFKLTLLMNSLLSLIVLPQQHNSRIRKLNFMNQNLANLEAIDYVLNCNNYYFDPRKYNSDLKNLLNRIRNGIAHQRIETISENGKWLGVIIEDYDLQNNLGLHLELTTAELKRFALFIANSYLNAVNSPLVQATELPA
ncbi:HEPN family nuclease [Flavobacterium sp.]|jgi:hypothetical protein|uniref:HEPN family nuclease n=1 Tax=Flavobacterium sp. TaxID=239 RepID=UPI0037C14558